MNEIRELLKASLDSGLAGAVPWLFLVFGVLYFAHEANWATQISLKERSTRSALTTMSSMAAMGAFVGIIDMLYEFDRVLSIGQPITVVFVSLNAWLGLAMLVLSTLLYILYIPLMHQHSFRKWVFALEFFVQAQIFMKIQHKWGSSTFTFEAFPTQAINKARNMIPTVSASSYGSTSEFVKLGLASEKFMHDCVLLLPLLLALAVLPSLRNKSLLIEQFEIPQSSTSIPQPKSETICKSSDETLPINQSMNFVSLVHDGTTATSPLSVKSPKGKPVSVKPDTSCFTSCLEPKFYADRLNNRIEFVHVVDRSVSSATKHASKAEGKTCTEMIDELKTVPAVHRSVVEEEQEGQEEQKEQEEIEETHKVYDAAGMLVSGRSPSDASATRLTIDDPLLTSVVDDADDDDDGQSTEGSDSCKDSVSSGDKLLDEDEEGARIALFTESESSCDGHPEGTALQVIVSAWKEGNSPKVQQLKMGSPCKPERDVPLQSISSSNANSGIGSSQEHVCTVSAPSSPQPQEGCTDQPMSSSCSKDMKENFSTPPPKPRAQNAGSTRPRRVTVSPRPPRGVAPSSAPAKLRENNAFANLSEDSSKRQLAWEASVCAAGALGLSLLIASAKKLKR